MSSAVRQTPLTAIESPCFVPSVTVSALITMRAFSPRSSTLRTLPRSSMIPVNIFQHTSQNLLNREAGRVDHDRVVSRSQRRIGARGVTSIAFAHLGECLLERDACILQGVFLETPFGAFF